MGLNTIFYYAAGLIMLYILGLILVWPIKKIMKLIFNGILGGITLLIFNFIGKFFGLSLAINPINALIVGFLGVPGVILLLILQVLL
ncbi:MAG TPA: pro-sigmaK processing inhibitor BofA family protein [Tissierellaceae bacterium]